MVDLFTCLCCAMDVLNGVENEIVVYLREGKLGE